MSNLNGSGQEYRWGRLSILEGATAIHQHVMQGFHLQETQLGGQGTGFRNWVYWAKNYKFEYYHKDISVVGDLPEKTYNEYFSFIEPQIQAPVDLTEDQMNDFISSTLKLPSGTEEIEDGNITLTGVLPDGTLQEVTIQGRAKIKHSYKTLGTYSGAYNATTLGEAYVWQQYDKYLKDNDYIKRQIFSDSEEKGYQCIPGDNLAEAGEGEDEVIQGEGSADDCWLQLGYMLSENHDDEGDEVVIELFNAEENIYIPVKSSIPSYPMYFAMWGYTYDIVELDAKQYQISSEGYLKLDSSGQPTKLEEDTPPSTGDEEEEEKPEPEWTEIKVPFEIDIETHEGTNHEEYESNVNYASVKGFGYIQDIKTAASNPSLSGSVDGDLETMSAGMCPVICFRHDKSWIDREEGGHRYGWYCKSVLACKKIQKDSGYYDEMYDELQKQITQGDVAWVYLIYGLPCNYTQTHYGAHYALQFFKQLTIKGWEQYGHGAVAEVPGLQRDFHYGYRVFNCYFHFSVHTHKYACGIGQCPAAGRPVKGGEAGSVQYDSGQVCFWDQSTDNTWEYITCSYYCEFSSIKNGVGASPGGNDWFLPLWKEENVERQYSKAIIPLMWEVGRNIPYTCWTDIQQFSQNIAATAYKVVKTKWYESGLFKVILIIVIIIITIIVSIFSCGTASGPAASAGASLAATIGGSTAFWTAVVSICISVAVAVVVNILITPLLKQIFGPVIGSILGAVISMIAGSYASTGTLSSTSVITEFTKPTTWINLANAAISGMQEVLQAKMENLQKQSDQFAKEAEEKQDEINAAWADTFGYKEGNAWAKANVQYGATSGNALDKCMIETGEQFCQRTIDNFTEACDLAYSTLENWPQTVIDSNTQPALKFASTGSSSNSLGQTV